jgi:hypothetical protein
VDNEHGAVRFPAVPAARGEVCSPRHGAGALDAARPPRLWTGKKAEPIFAFQERSAGSGRCSDQFS